MEDKNGEPEDVRKATSVDKEIERGERDDLFEGHPRYEKKRQKWRHCEDKFAKKPKKKASSNGDCCEKKKEKSDRMARGQMVVKVEKPCEIPKSEIIPRHCLTKEEHMKILATPPPRCPVQGIFVESVRRARPASLRIKELAKPTRHKMLMTLQEAGYKLPPSFVDNIIKSLEGEACLTPEQAEKTFRKKKRLKETKKGTKFHRVKTPRAPRKVVTTTTSVYDKDAVTCQYMIAEAFVKSILDWKCPIPKEEFEDISNVVMKRMKLTLDYTAFEDGDRKIQQMRFLSDVVACWISGILLEVAETQKRKLARYCEQKRRQLQEEAEEEEEEREEEILLRRIDRYDEDEDDADQRRAEEEAEEEERKEAERKRKAAEGKRETPPKTGKPVREGEEEMIEVEEGVAVEEEEKGPEEAEVAEDEEAERLRLEEEERKRQEEEEAERLRLEEEERKRQEEEEAERLRLEEEEAERLRLEEEEAEKLRLEEEEAERLRLEEEEAERLRLEEEEAERLRLEEEEAERLRLEEEEAERLRLEAEEAERLKLEEEEAERLRLEEEERKKAEEEAERLRLEEEERKKAEEEAVPAEEEKEEEEEVETPIEAGEPAPVTKEKEPEEKEPDVTKEFEKLPPKTLEALSDLFRTDLPFVTVAKIIQVLYDLVEAAPENMGEDPITNRLHRAIFDKFVNIVQAETPDVLSDNLQDVIDVVCGKIAGWLRNILRESQILLMERYPAEVESCELRDWSRWLSYVTDTAGEWSVWLRKVIAEADNLRKSELTRGEWKNWTSAVDTGALLWRRFRLQTAHRAHHNLTVLTNRQVVQTGEKKMLTYPTIEVLTNGPEKELKTTDLDK